MLDNTGETLLKIDFASVPQAPTPMPQNILTETYNPQALTFTSVISQVDFEPEPETCSGDCEEVDPSELTEGEIFEQDLAVNYLKQVVLTSFNIQVTQLSFANMPITQIDILDAMTVNITYSPQPDQFNHTLAILQSESTEVLTS
jgi:hypothetical protein